MAQMHILKHPYQALIAALFATSAFSHSAFSLYGGAA
jgi:hypothetical protein